MGDLSQALFGWSAYKPAGQKYERWAEVLFADPSTPRLRFPISLAIIPWRSTTRGPTGAPMSLPEAEEAVIDLAIAEFEDIVLNVAGETWWAPRSRVTRAGFAARPTKPVHYITARPALESAVASLLKEPLIGLDVETTIYDQQLCLVQLGGSTGTHLVDARAVDLDPLRPLLIEASVEKAIHNAPFERRILGQLGFEIDPVVDTLRLSRRLGGRTMSHRLDMVVGRELGIELDKGEQSSRWDRRPLSQAQLDYAALDAEVLLDLVRTLRRRDPQKGLDLSG